MTLDKPKEFVVQEKRDAKARLVINDELSSVCHCCTAPNIGAKVCMNSHLKIPISSKLHRHSQDPLVCATNQDVLLLVSLQ